PALRHDIHPPHQILEISRPRAQAVRHDGPKGFVGPAQLRYRELQRARLRLDLFRFVAVAPPNALSLATTIVAASQKHRRFGFDRHLQHVARPMNPAIGGSSIVVVASTLPNKPSVASLNRTLGGYSLHGVDLLRPRSQRSRLV